MTEQQLSDIALYLDDSRREALHSEMAPCEPVEFALEYFNRWPDEFRQCAVLAGLEFALDEARKAWCSDQSCGATDCTTCYPWGNS